MTEARYRRRDAWKIDESEFYELESRDAELKFLLRYAVLAPSSHNSQPWRFSITPDGIEVYADYTRRMPHLDPDNRELMMSVGAAIMNLRVAAAHFGFESTVLYNRTVCETPPVALVTLRETCDPDQSLAKLFPAITRRHTNRQPYETEPIDENALSALCDLADEYPEVIRFLLPRDRARIAELVAEGDRVLFENRAIREELADWLRPSHAGAVDGVCADALGVPELLSGAAPVVLRHLNIGPMQAARDEGLVRQAPLLAVITADDDQVALLEAGQVLERLLLTATASGLNYSFFNQPVEVGRLRKALLPIVRSTHQPQALLRIGHAPENPLPLPRRRLNEVMA